MSSAINNKEEDDNASSGMSSLSSTTMKNTSPNDNIINTITRVSDHNVAAADTEPTHTPQPPPIIVSAPIINDCNNNNNPSMHYNNMPHNNIMSAPQYNATVTLQHNNNINNIAVPSTAAPQQQTTHAPSSSYVMMSSENNNVNHLPSDNVNINMPIEASAYHTFPPQVTTSNPLNVQTRDGSIDHFASAANEHLKQPAFQAANNGSENLHQQHSSTSAIDQLLTLDMRSYQNLEDAIIQVKSYLENVRQLAYQNPALSSSTTSGAIRGKGELSFYDMIENTGVGGKERSLFVTIITGEGGSGTVLRSILHKIFHNRKIRCIDNGDEESFQVDALSEVRDYYDFMEESPYNSYNHHAAAAAAVAGGYYHPHPQVEGVCHTHQQIGIHPHPQVVGEAHHHSQQQQHLHVTNHHFQVPQVQDTPLSASHIIPRNVGVGGMMGHIPQQQPLQQPSGFQLGVQRHSLSSDDIPNLSNHYSSMSLDYNHHPMHASPVAAEMARRPSLPTTPTQHTAASFIPISSAMYPQELYNNNPQFGSVLNTLLRRDESHTSTLGSDHRSSANHHPYANLKPPADNSAANMTNDYGDSAGVQQQLDLSDQSRRRRSLVEEGCLRGQVGMTVEEDTHTPMYGRPPSSGYHQQQFSHHPGMIMGTNLSAQHLRQQPSSSQHAPSSLDDGHHPMMNSPESRGQYPGSAPPPLNTAPQEYQLPPTQTMSTQEVALRAAILAQIHPNYNNLPLNMMSNHQQQLQYGIHPHAREQIMPLVSVSTGNSSNLAAASLGISNTQIPATSATNVTPPPSVPMVTAATIPTTMSHQQHPKPRVVYMDNDEEIRHTIMESQASHIAHTRQQVSDDIQLRRALEMASNASAQDVNNAVSAEEEDEEQQMLDLARRSSIMDEEKRLHSEKENYDAELKRAMEKSEQEREEGERLKESEANMLKELMAQSEAEENVMHEDEEEVYQRAISTSLEDSANVDEDDLFAEAARKSLCEKVDENDLLAEAMRVSLSDTESNRHESGSDEDMLADIMRISLQEKEMAERELDDEEEMMKRAIDASMLSN